MYHDANSFPWEVDKRWEDLSPKEWIEVCSQYYGNNSLCTSVDKIFFWCIVQISKTILFLCGSSLLFDVLPDI